MNVILVERVPGVGNVGDVLNVKDGHARNFLIPKKLALVADNANKKFIGNQQKRLMAKVAEEKKASVALKSKIDALEIEIERRVSGNGRLYGTVNSADIVKILEEKGVAIERRHVQFEDGPIKKIGQSTVKVKFFSDVIASFSLKVSMDQNQQEEQKTRLAEIARIKAEAQQQAQEVAKEEKKEESSEKPESEESN